MSKVVDHEWHREVGETVAPRDFHNNVNRNEVVACIKHTNIAFTAADIDELGNLLVIGEIMRVVKLT